ncbi:MAG: site-2 protease family protein, partial [Gemmatimonadota bacterium]|nr:site-2 protease family protein [Gemmatimonadota bacterium]
MILTIAVTILVLGVLIFVHELGHFAAAKSVDIAVPRFSIGLGPKMVGFRRGETEYVISWIPLGGYVKMAG